MKRVIPFLLVLSVLMSGVTALSAAPAEPAPLPDMAVTSVAIVEGALGLPYGDKGEQFDEDYIPTLSPPLTIQNIPNGTAALAITMIDPDGGNWVHWLAVNIPVSDTTCEIPENASLDWPEDIIQGKNDFGTLGYGGPTPPSGVHRYVITVYALSEPLQLKAGFKLPAMKKALKNKVLAEATVIGTYAR